MALRFRTRKLLGLVAVCVTALLLAAAAAGAAKPGERHGKIVTFLPTVGAQLSKLAVAGDGTVWYSGYRTYYYEGTYDREAEASTIGHLTPGGQPTETALPKGTSAGGPVAVPGGDVWYPETDANEGAAPTVEVVGFSVAGGSQAYPVGAGVTEIDAMTTMGGDLWFSGSTGTGEGRRGVIGRVSLTGAATVSLFQLEPGCAAGEALGAGVDKVWFGEYCPGAAPTKGTGRAALGSIDATGSIARLPLPPKQKPVAVATAADSEVWVGMEPTRPGRPAPLVHLDAAGVETQMRVPYARFDGMTVGAEGRLWFSSVVQGPYYSGLASIGPAGHRSRPFCTGGSRNCSQAAEALASGPEGTLWFVGDLAGSFGTGGGGGAGLIEGEALQKARGVIGVVR